MGASHVLARVTILGSLALGGVQAACSSFGDSGVVDAPSPESLDAAASASANDAGVDVAIVGSDASPEGPSPLLSDGFADCAPWDRKQDAVFTHVATQRGPGGSCRLCTPTGLGTPFVERRLTVAAGALCTVRGWLHASDSDASTPARAAVGFQFLDRNGLNITARSYSAATAGVWSEASGENRAPAGTVALAATIEIEGALGSCFDIDDFSLSVAP